MEMASDDITNLHETLLNRASKVTSELLPKASRGRYEDVYKRLCEWCKSENITPNQVNDEILLAYMSEMAKQMKPNTLLSKFSIVRKCLQIKENIDASNFPKTIAFLRKQSTGYVPKKANVFTAEQINQFMVKAPDNLWLLDKVILIMGIFGACRRDDILNIKLNDVKDNGSYFTFFIRDDKSHKKRNFTITDDECPFQPCQLIRKYMLLRPAKMQSDRFFICYRKGKCAAQNVGVHKIGSVPKNVAQYLKLENPENYTGHALRRSSVSMILEGGADLLSLKRYGGWWKSASFAEGYTYNSVSEKSIKIVAYITKIKTTM